MMNVCHTTLSDNKSLVEEINYLRKKKNAVILAHYYQRGELQDVADYLQEIRPMKPDVPQGVKALPVTKTIPAGAAPNL